MTVLENGVLSSARCRVLSYLNRFLVQTRASTASRLESNVIGPFAAVSRITPMLGTTPEEIIGKPLWEVIGVEALETIRPYIESTLSGRTVEYEAEIPFARIGPRFLRVVDTPVIDDQGQVRGWIASMSDITERKRTEDEIAALNQQLARNLSVMAFGSEPKRPVMITGWVARLKTSAVRLMVSSLGRKASSRCLRNG